ncbi:TraB/VirB10 family protein, partial [Sutterella sp.]|uniref:TraB/VirB10 family protein n=1 Tax=Sutterella sp. TaxID=1981025 RepID=UPI0026E05A8D
APGGGRLAMVTLPVPQDTRRIPQRRYQVEPLYRPDVPIDVNRAEGLDAENYIPAGSFTKSTLLTGAYASTGGAAGSAPMPVLMKLNDLAVLPNRWRAAVKDCHVTGHATGDISSERVLIRLDRLACVGPKGQILDIRVSGYAVGPDGKVGIRAKLVTRSGQAIAAAISTGVISGISKSLSLSTQQISTSTLTGTQTVDFGNSALVGFGEAFSSAANRLMDYYLDLADKIMPVLELEAGIPLDLVFSRGTPLSSES